MSDFIKRLEIEIAELEVKISKLESFLTTPTFGELAKVDQILLQSQLEIMEEYSRILNARYARLTRG